MSDFGGYAGIALLALVLFIALETERASMFFRQFVTPCDCHSTIEKTNRLPVGGEE